MAAGNVTLSNGIVPTTTTATTVQPSPPKAQPGTAESILTTIALTIWDVIVFLAVSIGYIFQVSLRFSQNYQISFVSFIDFWFGMFA